MKSALIVIDLQNDFLSSGHFFNNPLSMKTLLPPLKMLVEATREASHQVVWVKSHYPQRSEPPPPIYPTLSEHRQLELENSAVKNSKKIPFNPDLLARGYYGDPCCVEGTSGADFHPQVAELIKPQDVQLIKTYYSAFAQTQLLEELHSRKIERLYICGVTADISVRATACDAFLHGFEVVVVSDVVTASKASLKRETLNYITKHYGTVKSTVNIMSDWRSVRSGLGAGDSIIYYGVLKDLDRDESIFTQVRDEVNWGVMHHRGGPVPRKIALQGDIDEDGIIPLYRHPADEHPQFQGYTPVVKSLRDLCNTYSSSPLNHILIQYYQSGEDYISAHSDKTLDLQLGSMIFGLSLGATRTFTLHAKQSSGDEAQDIQKIEVPHGSLFVIGWETNQKYHHEIRQDKRSSTEKRSDELLNDEQRISLTLRSIATFITPDGVIFGQGSQRKSLTDPAPVIHSLKEEAELMLSAFAQENQSDDQPWEAFYQRGFEAIDLNSLLEEEP